jgi:hypothetical protein
MRKPKTDTLQIETAIDLSPLAKFSDDELYQHEMIKQSIDAKLEEASKQEQLIASQEIPMFYGTKGEAMSIGTALTLGFIQRSSIDDDSIKIGDLVLPIDAAIGAKLINEAAGKYIKENVQGRSEPAPFTRYDAIEQPEEAVKEATKGKILDALVEFFKSPSPETKRGVIEAVQNS